MDFLLSQDNKNIRHLMKPQFIVRMWHE